MFKINPLYMSDGYKVNHLQMLAPGTTKLYGTWIPRSTKHAPKGITKVLSVGQQLCWRWIHDLFEEYFFYNKDRGHEDLSWVKAHNDKLKAEALQFAKDMCDYLGMKYDGQQFEHLWDLGYLPVRVKSLPEGLETEVNIPHMTFINTVDGFGWLTLFLETIVSNHAWKMPSAATIALKYRRTTEEWVHKTDPETSWLIPFMCHDFSARGLSGDYDVLSVGLGHATCFRGSDTLAAIPAARYFYGEKEVCINSVNASEHSVTSTGIFYYEDKLRSGELNDRIKEYYSYDLPCEGSVENPDYKALAEWLNLEDWLGRFPTGILSIVSDTFDLWKLITFILPRLKDKIMARDGKLVIRPDSGDPVDIICGVFTEENVVELEDADENSYLGLYNWNDDQIKYFKVKEKYYLYQGWEMHVSDATEVKISEAAGKGVIELLWDIFGGEITSTGYKRLDSHIGAIYGDSITTDRQVQIYERLAAKGFASTNIVLGVGSFTFEYMTRDTFGLSYHKTASPFTE